MRINLRINHKAESRVNFTMFVSGANAGELNLSREEFIIFRHMLSFACSDEKFKAGYSVTDLFEVQADAVPPVSDTKIEADMPSWLFTFCSDSALANRYVEIYAKTYGDARDTMVANYGERWAFQYEDEEKAGVKQFRLIPLEPIVR